MDVGLAAHGRGVAEPARDLAHDLCADRRRGGLAGGRRRRAGGAQQLERLHAAVPGAEVLGRVALAEHAGGLAQVVVDVARADAAHRAVLVLVGEQLLAGQLLAAPHHPCHARILHGHLVLHPALAAKAQPQAAAAHAGVLAAQRGEAVGAVLARVALVAHAHEGGVEQPHERRQQLRTLHRGARPRAEQVACDSRADARQRAAEGLQPGVLAVAAFGAPVGVVAVLLAPACVAAGGLQMAVRQRADPDVGIGRRNRQAADARQLALVDQQAAVGPLVAERRAAPHAPMARHRVADVDEAGGHRQRRRRLRGLVPLRLRASGRLHRSDRRDGMARSTARSRFRRGRPAASAPR